MLGLIKKSAYVIYEWPLSKMDEEELANLDTEAIMIKQVEELENEKRQLIARLKSQEKKVDHLERAKRKEEIPLIKESMIQVSFFFTKV